MRYAPIILLLALSARAETTHYTGQTKKGIDFFVFGDYGNMEDEMAQAKQTFAAMDEVMGLANNETSPEDLIDFIALVGDNLYPLVEGEPTDEEFDMMLSLFQGENMKNIDAMAIRGNVDCEFEWWKETQLTRKYSHWIMPSLYYEMRYDIGNGKKFAMLHVDTCLLLCSTYNRKEGHHTYFPNHHCFDFETRHKGNEQYKWILETLESWNQDESIVWRGAIQHHNLFGKKVHDYTQLLDNYLPILTDYKVDFYFNGHEHDMVYVNYPFSQDRFDEEQEPHIELEQIACQSEIEMHFNDLEKYQEFYQGEHIHQITSGAAGKPLVDLCAMMPSAGRFKYAQNKYPGWAQVHMDEDEVVIRYRGLDKETEDIVELYQVKIFAKKETDPSE